MAAPSSPGSWKQRAAELQQRWQSLAAAAPDDPVLLKASATLQNLEDLCLETESFNISSFLQLYSKAILDITFYEENRLVDEDFPDDSSLQKVKDLIQILSEPEVLVKETNLFKKPPVIALEDEVTECLHWRRGALLYMYCHTVRDREDWLLRNKSTFNQCLKDGVCYLLNMLKSQIPVQLNDATFKDPGTAFLLKQGVFSDIHVLALMYCGELCYWTVLHGCEQGHTFNDGLNTECCDETQMTTLNFQEVGINVLEKYVSVCEGPLQGQGWNTENAKNSLQFLKKAGT